MLPKRPDRVNFSTDAKKKMARLKRTILFESCREPYSFSAKAPVTG